MAEIKQAKRPEPASAVGTSSARGALSGTGRVVRLNISYIDPFSVLKLSFLLSVALGIATVVAVIILWSVLQAMGVFDQIGEALNSKQTPSEGSGSALSLSRAISFTVVLSVVNMLLLTAISTVAAYLYNFGASLVGGLSITVTDERA